MAAWTVFEHDRHGSARAERAVFVRDGFSWSALLFGTLWLAANGLWFLFVALTIGAVALTVLVGETLGEPAAIIVAVGIHVWFGFEARGLRRWALVRRGWRLTGAVEGRGRVEAERRYYKARLAPATARRTGPPSVLVTPTPAHAPAPAGGDGAA